MDVRQGVENALADLASQIGADRVHKLVAIYERSARGQLESLSRALEERDASALGQTAHSLKSSSASLGARQVSSLCLELETLGYTGQLDGAEALLAHLQASLAELLALLPYCLETL